MSEALDSGKKIYELVNELKKLKEDKENIFKEISLLKKKLNEKIINETIYSLKLKTLLKNIPEREYLELYKKKISSVLDSIKNEDSKIYNLIKLETQAQTIRKGGISPAFLKLSKIQMKKYLKDLNITHEDVENFIKEQKKKGARAYQEVEYTIYKSSEFGKLANRFVEPISLFLLKKSPDMFAPLLTSLKLVNLNMLSKTYVSVILFSSIVSFFVFSILFSLILMNSISGIGIGIVMFILTIIFTYYYPSSMIGTRRRKIKNELPFAIVHMAAVAGSGTQPINMFKLLIESQEYPEIGKEMKKIMNYVYIFGYNLSTALKSVADATPSIELRELLNGIISTIETGGDLRSYLDNKAVDALATYQLDRRKYVETLATYSDVYTAILVAAPLLFVTTLAIINVIGANLGGISITTIAFIGTFGLVPALNIGFIIFLNITQPEL